MAILSPLVVTGLILCLLMPARCAANNEAEPAAVPAPAWAAAGELILAEGTLSLSRDGAVAWSRAGDGVLPYRIVSAGAPALVTTVGPGLALATHCPGAAGAAYADYYPALAGDGWAVLAAMPRINELPAMAVVLLDAGGTAIWRHAAALVLWPAVGADVPADPAALYFTTAGDTPDELNTLIYPLGLTPRLVSLEPRTGARRWETAIPTDYPVVHAELLALGDGYGLLALQYDYLIFELVCFNTADGGLTGRHRLQGIIAQRLAYPGPGSEYLDAGINGDTFTALVNIEGEGPQRWELDLAAGTLRTVGAEFAGGAPVEENGMPVGGSGTPGPGGHPLDQTLLPTAAGDSWRIPALVDGDGNTVVATSAGLVIIGPTGDEIPAKR